MLHLCFRSNHFDTSKKPSRIVLLGFLVNMIVSFSISYLFFNALEKEKIRITIPKVIKKLNKMKRIIPVLDSESNKVNSCCMCYHSLSTFYHTIREIITKLHILQKKNTYYKMFNKIDRSISQRMAVSNLRCYFI